MFVEATQPRRMEESESAISSLFATAANWMGWTVKSGASAANFATGAYVIATYFIAPEVLMYEFLLDATAHLASGCALMGNPDDFTKFTAIALNTLRLGQIGLSEMYGANIIPMEIEDYDAVYHLFNIALTTVTLDAVKKLCTGSKSEKKQAID